MYNDSRERAHPDVFSDVRTLASRDRPNVFRKPPERAEYTTESEVEESEFDQTRHNRCGLLRPTAYSDSDRLVDTPVHSTCPVVVRMRWNLYL